MLSNTPIYRIVINLILGYLLISFIFSSYFAYRSSTERSINTQEIAYYAQSFLKDKNLIDRGSVFDCSGFTQFVYSHFNLDIPRSSSEQFKSCMPINSNYRQGDLVFFKTSQQEIGHVGIYLGDSLFIHSPGVNDEVKLDSLSNPYYFERLVGFGRFN